MSKQKNITEWCEEIDAAIFSGDMLQTCNLNEFKEYLGRWQRAVEKTGSCNFCEKTADLELNNAELGGHPICGDDDCVKKARDNP